MSFNLVASDISKNLEPELISMPVFPRCSEAVFFRLTLTDHPVRVDPVITAANRATIIIWYITGFL